MKFSLIFMALLLAFTPTLVTGTSDPCEWVDEEKCETVPREVCDVSGTSSYRGMFSYPNQLS